MEAVYKLSGRLHDQGKAVAFDVLFNVPVALVGRQPLVPWHVSDLLAQQDAGRGLDPSGRYLRHPAAIAVEG